MVIITATILGIGGILLAPLLPVIGSIATGIAGFILMQIFKIALRIILHTLLRLNRRMCRYLWRNVRPRVQRRVMALMWKIDVELGRILKHLARDVLMPAVLDGMSRIEHFVSPKNVTTISFPPIVTTPLNATHVMANVTRPLQDVTQVL